MTVEVTTSRITYTGAGTTGPFSINFYFLANADIKAFKVLISDGTQTELTLTTDYTLTGAGDADGGTLTLTSSLSSDYKLVIYRDPEVLQESAYPKNDPFPAATHETVVDRLTMICQRLVDRIGRTIRLLDSDTTGVTLTLPAATAAARSDKVIGFNTDGDELELKGSTDSTVLAAQLASSAAGNGAALVAFAQSGTGAIATEVQARIRAGKPLLIDFIPTARHSEIAARTCTTDLTTYINTALAEMTSRGGGIVEAPLGLFPWEGTIAVPAEVGLMGFGKSHVAGKGTEFKAQNAAAKFTFGGIGEANGQRGAKTGHFRVHANSLATQPFYIGRSVHRFFEEIDIENSAQDGLTLEEGQNNVFINVNTYNSARHDFMIDKGAGGNAFFRCQSDTPGEYSLYIQESTGIGPYGAQGPSHNGFYHCLFERSVAGKALYHGGGLDNIFDNCIFAADDATSAASLILMEIAGSATSSGRLRLFNPQLFGSQTYSTGIELAESGVSALIIGRIKANSLLNLFSIATGSEIDVEDYAESAVTNTFTGTGAQNTIVRKRFSVPLQLTRTATGDDIAIARVSGDAGARFSIAANGQLRWRDGSDFSYDVNLYRASGTVLATDDDFQAARLFSKQGSSSTALPAVTIASRNTTAAGNTGTGEDDLMTYSMVANAFSAATKGVKIKAWGTGANNANAKTVKLYFGSTAICTASLTTSQANKWEFEGVVMSTAGAGVDAQDYWVKFKQWGTTGQDDAANGSTTADEESAITIKCTGEATSDNDIVQEGMIVEFLN